MPASAKLKRAGAGIVREEQDLHRAVVAHLRTRGIPGLLFWHTPQGAHYSSRVQGAIMHGLGVRAGVPDLLIMQGGRLIALELKARGRKPTKAQLGFLGDFVRAGGWAEWADSLDRALEVLTGWGLLRGKVQ